MISTEQFCAELKANGVGFFSGVPDSLLKDICAYISDTLPPSQHIINANEGAAVGVAAGYHLATGKIPAVYLQNSGLGNIVNPVLSLADAEVYSLPLLLIIGWRGEPGVKDEPQHVKQGRVMVPMLDSMEIGYDVIDASTTNFAEVIKGACAKITKESRPHALLIKKETFEPYQLKSKVKTDFALSREAAIELIVNRLDKNAFVVSTTGMASRELFELRKKAGQSHENDFLTVGSMGHCSQIAMGLALEKPNKEIICIDGDGALLMHLGSLAIIGTQSGLKNLKHIVLNNGAHDSVGGQPTVGFKVDFGAVAKACGYQQTFIGVTKEEVEKNLNLLLKCSGPALLEIRVNKGARKDLGRPTSSPIQNKAAFVKALNQ